MADLITRKTALSENVISFCRFLRTRGFAIGPTEEADALRALTFAPVGDRESFRLTLRAILPRNRKQQDQFDELYEYYWKQLEKAVDAKIVETEEESPAKKGDEGPPKPPSIQALKDWLYGNKKSQEEEIEMAVYSPGEAMTYKDFGEFADEDLAELMRMIDLIARSLAMKFNRRSQKTHSHATFDLKRTIRQNLRRGGEILDLAHKKRQKRRLNLVLICDVSKSMDLYSRFLVQFIYAFQTVYKRIETFVFSTALYRVTDAFKEDEFAAALDKMSMKVPGWSGGTQIGKSLDEFVQLYGSRMLNNRTVVMIISDGWDSGDTELLTEAMQTIRQKAAKVVWLNPLAGNPEYEPLVKGMAAAMPFIDIFASAHNLDSLKKVVRDL